MTSSQILSWLSDHAASLWPVVSALLVIALRSRTPEAWVALGETSPRWQGVIRLLRAVGLDPAKALSAIGQIVTGRAPARALQIADTVQRATQAPPPSNPQSGRARLGALVVLLVVGLGIAVVTNGCDPIREGVMRITPGVPSPSPCVPDSQRCAGAVPEVCSQSSMGNTRWWPSLSLRADGTQRVCSNGCVVDDAGVAGCAPVLPANPFADGGAL